MEENNELYEQYFEQVVHMLDNNDVFEEFDSPINNISTELAAQTNAYVKTICKDAKFNNYIFAISALITLNMMCKRSNKFSDSDIELYELPIFNGFYIDTIDFAKYFSDLSGVNLDDTLLYGFAYANYSMSLADEDKKRLNFYKKELVKPLSKYFIKEYKSARKARRIIY